jgi:type IV secretory pathway TrbF-like protein
MVGEPPGSLDHHFLEGRQYRADEIGEVVAQRNWWRLATLALTGVLGIAVLGLLYVGAQPKVIPYIVTWNNSTGELLPLQAQHRVGDEPVTLRLMLREFVTALRSVSTDTDVMRDWWKVAMQRVTKEGKARLVAYAAARKPLEQHDPVSVEILHILHTTGRTWQVRWEESTYSGSSGHLLERKRAVGSFTYRQETPRTREVITYNPAGVFFHEWNWSYE